MATKAFVFNGAEFVTNNYAAILNKNGVDSHFHIIQDFLLSSEVGFTLINPPVISRRQVLEFWRTANFDDGGDNGIPSIVFSHGDEDMVVTPTTVRAALHLPNHESYTIYTGDSPMRDFFTSISYSGPLDKMGQLKRLGLRKEWNFYFDYITRAFSKNCTNFDALP